MNLEGRERSSCGLEGKRTFTYFSQDSGFRTGITLDLPYSIQTMPEVILPSLVNTGTEENGVLNLTIYFQLTQSL
jgi:hypothetical protein